MSKAKSVMRVREREVKECLSPNTKRFYGMLSFTSRCPGCVPLAPPVSGLALAEPVAPYAGNRTPLESEISLDATSAFALDASC